MDEDTMQLEEEKTPLQNMIDKYNFKQRTLFLDSDVDVVAFDLIRQIKILERESPTEEIKIIINSDGGDIYDTLGLYDVIQNCTCPITTIVLGRAFSAAAWILISGTKRLAYPNARIMLHEGTAGTSFDEKISDLKIRNQEIQDMDEVYLNILKKHTKITEPFVWKDKTYKEIKEWLKEDRYIDALQAKEMGIIDEII